MKIGFVIGRFQTDKLHAGHRHLIEKVIEDSDHVVILLGCAVPKLSLKNPLDFETRKAMVLELYPDVEVKPLFDNKSDKVWSENLDQLILDVVSDFIDGGSCVEWVLHHSRDSFRSHYLGTTPCKEWVTPHDTSATAIRTQIAQMKPLSSKDFRTGIIYGATHQYPKVLATVDAFVYNLSTEKVLLGKRKDELEWRLFGGFSDPTLDDSFKLACQRELQEESGLVVPIGNFECIDSFKINDWRYRSETDKIITTLFWVDVSNANLNVQAADDINELAWFDIDVVFGAWSDVPLKIVKEHEVLIKAAHKHFKDIKDQY